MAYMLLDSARSFRDAVQNLDDGHWSIPSSDVAFSILSLSGMLTVFPGSSLNVMTSSRATLIRAWLMELSLL